MKKWYVASIASILFFVFLWQRQPYVFATIPTDQSGSIPSDLAVDLMAAEKDPHPDQKILQDSQAEEAVLTNDTGESDTIVPEDIVPTEITTEPESDAIRPEQNSSEEIKEIPDPTESPSLEEPEEPPLPTETLKPEDIIPPTETPTETVIPTGAENQNQ